jgi:hypothetical protein
MFSDSILNKLRLYFKLHPDYWEAWKEGNFDCCIGCRHVKSNGRGFYYIGCKKKYLLLVDIELTEIFFGDPWGIKKCCCVEWVKDV